MKTIHSTAIIALMTAALGLSAVAPVAAQSATPVAQTKAGDNTKMADMGQRGNGQRQHGNLANRNARGGALGGLLNFRRGAEGIEIAVVKISHAIDLTDQQKTLLDDLKTTALAAQGNFAATVSAARPAADANTQPDMVDRIKSRAAIETAHADALTKVLPRLEAFADSLTDEQKTKLAPQRRAGENGRQMGRGDGNQRHEDRNRQHDSDRRGAPEVTNTVAPTDAPVING
ncbi:Spy/CpxP family protein refolding chaperone [Devosia rhodophyticola]|uniref:Spy/CpxP family protein refolding chaperone n=1 Tax=Devosia rhodophyticola TaxID=3026423 RepID=A0ABY7YW19_9HYPH|nr:Spy/CpxP family protein refolding chaperone [Devosia rhodophyticola]WDR05139.1 Spy/CpxP family protein refolding chaperone [Devosia rhodophyticola]